MADAPQPQPSPAFRRVSVDDQQGGNIQSSGRFAGLRVPKAEVRRCGTCGKDAVIVCQAWAHSFNGVQTGVVTRECACQACGAKVTLRDPSAIRSMKIAAWILVIAILPTPFLLYKAWRWGRSWDRNPLVPDAPRPRVQHWRGPGNRRCGGCGKIARLVGVTRHTHNGIPTGTDCAYACPGCNRSFETESLGGLLFSFFVGGGIAAAGAGWFWLSKEATPWRTFGGPAVALCGLWLVLRALRRAGAAISNPRLSGEDAAA
jgi:hypothetical protein